MNKRKIFSAIVSVIMVFSMIVSFGMTSYANESFNLGDLNGDSKITAADARKILRAAARLDELTPEEFDAADINGDGKVNASDARIALRISAKIESIEDYVNTQPPVEDEIADLSELYYMNIEYVMEIFPDLVQDDIDYSLYYNEFVTLYTDEFGDVIQIVLDGETEYPLCAFTFGMDYADVAAVLDEYEYYYEEVYVAYGGGADSIILSLDDDEYRAELENAGYSLCYAMLAWDDFGNNLLIEADFDGNLVDHVTYYYEAVFVEELTDLSELYNMNIEYVMEIFPDMEQDSYDALIYFNSFATLTVDEFGNVIEVGLYGENYTLCGLTYGMDFSEAVYVLDEYEFSYEYMIVGYGPYGEKVIFEADDTEFAAKAESEGYSLCEAIYAYDLYGNCIVAEEAFDGDFIDLITYTVVYEY